MRADIVPGGIFPDYDLTDHAKTRRRLSELQGIDPMILVLSRGGFCPKDHQQHVELAANYPKIRRRRAFQRHHFSHHLAAVAAIVCQRPEHGPGAGARSLAA